MKDYKELSYFKRWTLENYPFIEADFDAITEYQLYCKIVEYLNKCIYNIKLMENAVDDVVQQIADLKAYVDQYLKDITEVLEEVEEVKRSVEELTLEVASLSDKIDQVDLKVDNLKVYTDNLVNTNYNTLKAYVDYQDNVINTRIDNLEIGAIRVYDPTTGLNSPLQTVIDNLYGLTNRDGITASEFDTLEKTVTQFEAYDMTAYEFDSSAKAIMI